MDKRITLILVSMIVGLLIVLQFRSYMGVQTLLSRDSSEENVVSTIYALKTANESLKEDISALEEELELYSDQSKSHELLMAEIEKNEILLGFKPISGPGLTIDAQKQMSVAEIVDFVNEWWAVGAEAIAVNNYRITESSNGFLYLNNLLLFDGHVLDEPLTFTIIGDTDVLETRLLQLEGDRFIGEKSDNLTLQENPENRLQSE